MSGWRKILCFARTAKRPPANTLPGQTAVGWEPTTRPSSQRSSGATARLNACDAACGDPGRRQAAEAVPSDVLDLEKLLGRCMGNSDLVQRVLRTFQERVPEEMKTIEQALERNDAEEIARAAHRVKGSSASMSAEGMVRAAAAIEEVSRAGRVAEIPASLDRLHDEWERYLEYAVTLLSAADSA
jgi:HPt (histidine-containing phosphotransfer) domain-containing protein